MASIRASPPDGEMNWPKIPKERSAVTARDTSTRHGIAELERLLGQSYAENELLKKAFAMTQKKVREERLEPKLRDDI
jgi:hypothetical protein